MDRNRCFGFATKIHHIEEVQFSKMAAIPPILKISALSHIRALLAAQESSSTKNGQSAWSDLVREYSSRRQSLSDDKINTFRGVASRFQKVVDDECIAGI